LRPDFPNTTTYLSPSRLFDHPLSVTALPLSSPSEEFKTQNAQIRDEERQKAKNEFLCRQADAIFIDNTNMLEKGFDFTNEMGESFPPMNSSY